jgi:methylase of polypeptide subunit release factors
MKARYLLLAAMLVAAPPWAAWAQASPDEATVRTGGVGLEEREALDAQRDRYNLRLAFAEKNGSYLADVAVRLSTADGKEVYRGNTDGPWLFAHLKPGKYQIEADYAGDKQVRMLAVGAQQSAPLVILHWPGTSR